MTTLFKVLAFTSLCLPAMAQLSVPKIGTARYPDGSLHTVQGLPANMIIADLPLDPAEAASFSDSGGMVFEHGTIRLLKSDFSQIAEYPAGEKPVLSLDGTLTSALAWLPNAHTLVHWNGTAFDSFEVDPNQLQGVVTDIQSSGAKEALLLVQHPDSSDALLAISLRTGNLVSYEPLPGVRGYAFGQGLFVVFANGKELVADNLRGYRRTVPMPAADVTVERMSNDWLHLYSASLQQHWALHLTQANLDLSLLPGLPDRQSSPAMASNTAGSAK